MITFIACGRKRGVGVERSEGKSRCVCELRRVCVCAGGVQHYLSMLTGWLVVLSSHLPESEGKLWVAGSILVATRHVAFSEPCDELTRREKTAHVMHAVLVE